MAVFSSGFTLLASTWWLFRSNPDQPLHSPPAGVFWAKLQPRNTVLDENVFTMTVLANRWRADANFSEIRSEWSTSVDRTLGYLDQELYAARESHTFEGHILATKASISLGVGEAEKAYDLFAQARVSLELRGGVVKQELLSSLIFSQGVAGLRQGENENCVLCRGESSCILPISTAAVHKIPLGSRRAIRHFMEYLELFPGDLEARWLLNLAHMTLGEHPHSVDARFVILLDDFQKSEVDIGQFQDIGHLVGVDQINMSGGAIMDDFDNDGWLDLVVALSNPVPPLRLYRNLGNGKFQDSSEVAGVTDQPGGLSCTQTDFNNDGLVDIYIPRGAWLSSETRPSLLRNDGGFRFVDVTADSGLLDPVNSNAAQWADYDNDGWLDLFVCCERQAHRLYRNRGDGTFEECANRAGLTFDGQRTGKGCVWFDYNNDDFPDLFVNYLNGVGQLYRNDGNGKFSNVSKAMGIHGPQHGFSCWAWDYNNDGWLDLFATSYDRTLKDVVRGMIGIPHELNSSKLYLNHEGERFQDVTRATGLNLVFSAMGTNYADFDNDGFLDMYLGTGEARLTMLVPNRMFKNLTGERFTEITASARVGHLQKGHGVACGDWDRDGNVDLFVQTGGAVPGDRYHNVLFQNPGHPNAWITVKLVGKRTNRAAIGVRMKVVTVADRPLTVHRHISSGSSFGGNPLEQTVGLGPAERIATLEVHWPASGTTQVFHELDVNQAIEITEFDDHVRKLDWKRIPVPENTSPKN